MKKFYLLLVVSLLFITLPSFKEIDGPRKAAPGTYQFIIKDTKTEFVYTDELLIMIEEKRKDHEEITIALSAKIAVLIPSRDQVQSPAFKPLAEFFYK